MTSARLTDSFTTRRRRRGGFSIVEVLMALTITSLLMTSLLVALDASFKAYQSTTETASRHTVARLMIHRLLTMIRTGSDFGPVPVNVVATPIIETDNVEFLTAEGQFIRVEYREDESALYAILDPDGAEPVEQLLVSGITPRYDEDGVLIPPFTLHYQKGPKLYRATIDLLIDENPSVELAVEGSEAAPPLRLIASTMPRNNLY